MSLQNSTTSRSTNIPTIGRDGKIYTSIAGWVILVISTVGLLNIPLIWCHTKKTQSVEKVMFIALAVSDLLTSCPLGFTEAIYLINFWHNNHSKFYGSDVKYNCDILLNVPGKFSMVFSTLLAVLRAIKITNPFYSINGKIVFIVVLIEGTALVVYMSFVFRNFHVYEEPRATFDLIRGGLIFAFSIALMGTISSIYSMVKLFRRRNEIDSPGRNVKHRAVITLFLMNLPYMAELIVSTAYFFSVSKFTANFDVMIEMHFVVGPIFTAAYNAAILFARKTQYRKQLKEQLRKSTTVSINTTSQL